MKNIMLLMMAAACLMLTAAVSVCADPGSGFDYSAEKMECRILPPVFDTEESEKNRGLLGSVTASDWSAGPEDAVLTIIEYADFQCPYCAEASLNLMEYQKKHSSEVRLIYRHFPLSFHEKAVTAALAADAAGYQGMFFEAEQFLFETQDEWSVLEENEAFREWLIREFGGFSDLDFDLWYLAFSDSDLEAGIRNLYSQVIKTGAVSGTPTVFLNFTDSNYMFDEASLDAFLEKLRTDERAVSECPDVVIKEGTAYSAVLETDRGNIRVELFADTAPRAVNSFVFLAETGRYDGALISRGYDGSILTAESAGNPGYGFEPEYDSSRIFDGSGYLGFEGSGMEPNAGRFFITDDIREIYEEKIRSDSSGLDIPDETVRRYVTDKISRFSRENTVFGRICGEDMDKLALLESGVVINRIRIEE